MRVSRLLTVLCLIAAALAVAPPNPTAAAFDETTAYRPVAPCRLLDTRREPPQRVSATTVRVQVAGKCAVPGNVAAAVLTLTAVGADAAGHVTAYPAASSRPNTSNINYVPGRTVANTVIVAVSGSGAIDIYTHAPVDIIVDVSGAFVPVDGPVSAGRLVATTPTRLADTRRPTSGLIESGSLDLRLPLPSSIPADATGVAVSLISVDAEPGHLTVYPSGGARPNSSVLNTDGLNRTRATTVLAPVSRDGIMIHRVTPGHVVVDLWGWFTGPSSSRSTNGLFVPESPTRVWDSRTSHDPLHPGGNLTRQVAPSDVAVAALNITVVEGVRPGHVTIGPAGNPRPDTSSVNHLWREPIAVTTLVRNTTAGVTFWSHSGAHVVVDRLGSFTGSAASTTAIADRNPMPNSGGRVLFVSDSSFAAIRWSGSLGLLQGAEFDSRLESCRRLIGASCRGREGYTPRTALAEVQRVAPGTFDTLIIGTGYDDFASRFHEGFTAVMHAARSKGIRRVVWLTYREDVGYTAPYGASYAATYAADNAILRAERTSGRWPELILLDWDAHTAGHPEWVASDGVHFTAEGAREAARFVSRALAHYDRRPCPTGIGGATAPGGWCADPT
jgi:hypothetical protein